MLEIDIQVKFFFFHLLIITFNNSNNLFTFMSTDDQCEEHTLATFSSLCNILEFFDLYHLNKDAFALKKLNDLVFIPSRLDHIDFCVRQFKKYVKSLFIYRFFNLKHIFYIFFLLKSVGAQVSKVLPDLLLAAMDILYRSYKELKERNPDYNNVSFFFI